MIHWSSRRIAIQIALMIACFAGANFFKIPVIALVWIVVALGLGIYWEIQDRAAYQDDLSEPPSPLLVGRRGGTFASFVVPALIGVVAVLLVVAADLSVTRSMGITISLLGIPYLVPLGAIAWGVMAASGYATGLKLIGRRPESADYYLMLGLALLALILINVISARIPGLQVDAKAFSAFIGPAPWPQITSVVQIIGVALGGTIAFLRAGPMSKPWTHS